MLHRQAEAHQLACQPTEWAFTFIVPVGFHTQWLAYTLNSLVRVSRRVG
jgi:hypothetical protein